MMPVYDDRVHQDALESRVGVPQERFENLLETVLAKRITSFAEVEREFLGVLWSLDSYRTARVVPRQASIGARLTSAAKRLDGIYRGKGNYYSRLIAALVGNATSTQLASRADVVGFSQPHQIDVAWPARTSVPLVDPLVCCEVKLTGAPAYDDNPERGAFADWTNRRKELKFQAADLKLYRKAQATQIDHWDFWRRDAPPAVYSIWGARLKSSDSVDRMIQEARSLSDTYMDGVGVWAYRASAQHDAYESVQPPKDVAGRVTSVDNILGIIGARIKSIMRENGDEIPEAVRSDPVNRSQGGH